MKTISAKEYELLRKLNPDLPPLEDESVVGEEPRAKPRHKASPRREVVRARSAPTPTPAKKTKKKKKKEYSLFHLWFCSLIQVHPNEISLPSFFIFFPICLIFNTMPIWIVFVIAYYLYLQG